MIKRKSSSYIKFLFPVVGVDCPERLAAGFVLGLTCGLIPFESAITWAIALAAVLSTANLLTGAIGVSVGILCTRLFDPLMDKFGGELFSVSFIQPAFAWLSTTPGIAWANLDNTLVVGYLIAVAVASWPLYVSSKSFFYWFRPLVVRWLNKYPSTQWMTGDAVT